MTSFDVTSSRYRLFSLPSLGLLLVIALGGGTTSALATSAEAPARGVTQAVLAPEGYVRLPDGTQLTFAGVLEDSRCPTDVVCVWPGRAVLAFDLTTAAGSAQPFEVVYEGRPTTQTSDGSAVTVLDLQPHPVSTQPIEPDDYRITVSLGAVIITEADFGGTIDVQIGQTVVVDPNGDYIWTATAADPTVLEALPQILIFPPPPPAFTAGAAGATTLRIVQEHLCRYSNPPCLLPEQIYEVQVVVH